MLAAVLGGWLFHRDSSTWPFAKRDRKDLIDQDRAEHSLSLLGRRLALQFEPYPTKLVVPKDIRVLGGRIIEQIR